MSSVELHNRVVSYKELKHILPSRNSFLNPSDVKTVNEKLRRGDDVLFLPSYLKEIHMQDEKYKPSLYKILLMGVFKDGRKASVILDGIMPYFEVRVPTPKKLLKHRDELYIKCGKGSKSTYLTENEYINKVRKLLSKEPTTTAEKISIIKAKPFKGFQEHNSKFIRFYYNKTKNRKTAIDLVRLHGYETATDDKANYYRVVCRDNLTTFSSWVTLSNYNQYDGDYIKGANTYRLNIRDYVPVPEEEVIKQGLLKDKTLAVHWDIETRSPAGNLPMPENKDDEMACIGMTFCWVTSEKPFLKIALCDFPSAPDPNHLTVVCGNETNLINAFGDVFEKMRPEFITGFNDSDYDWRWLVVRASQSKGVLRRLARKLDCVNPWKPYSDDDLLKWNYRKETVKLDATTDIIGRTLSMVGYTAIDVRTVFRKLHPTAESSSLSWFLKKNNLGSKEDMPYKRMFRIYNEIRDLYTKPYVIWNRKRGDLDFQFNKECKTEVTEEEFNEQYSRLKKELSEVNKYCVIDAQRCHELLKIRAVIMDHREISNLSYCSLYDAFYRANGMKVRNLTIAEGQKMEFRIRFSNIAIPRHSDAKYPGAYVFPPKKGLRTSKLSIPERIKKAEMTLTMKNKDCQEWLGTSEEDIAKYYKFIEKFGAYLTKENVEDIENGNPITNIYTTPLEEELKSSNNTSEDIISPEEKKDYDSLSDDGCDDDYEIANNSVSPDEEDIKLIKDKKFKQFLMEPMGRPITGLDFSSLYPSLMRTYNFSPEYWIWDKKYAREYQERTGQRLTRVDFMFGSERIIGWFVWHNNKLTPHLNVDDEKDEDLSKYTKLKSGKYLDPEFQFGIYPYILNDLFYRRKAIKKKMKVFVHEKEEMEAKGEQYIADNLEHYEDVCFHLNYYNSKQLALKVFMNTFYGEAGNQVSPFFVVAVAGGITSYGQKNIKRAQQFVEDDGCIAYYGDSVAEYTPVLVRINKEELSYGKIQDLATDDQFSPTTDGTKEIAFLNGYEIWSENGWTELKHVIRHKTNKQMYRVLTHTSVIDVTEDHSLLDSNGDEITPNDNLVGTELLSKKCIICPTKKQISSMKKDIISINDGKYKIKSQLSTYTFIKLCEYVGHNYEVGFNKDNEYIVVIHKEKINIQKNNNVVKKVIKLPKTNQYVYDVETSNHHFAAGVGSLIVHNTDSIYLSTPDRYFKQYDIDYFTGKTEKLKYWTQLVEETFTRIKPINAAVNDMFFKNNGTRFLTMAYEEVLFPVIFTAKKKYYGIPHENIANFKPKSLFVRGLEVKKRGVSDLLRKIFNKLMWDSVNPENLYTLIEMVQMTIDEIYASKWELDDFTQTDVFRPNKNNVKVHTFVNRMAARGITVPSNERFKYVMVKKYPYTYDYRGRKEIIKAGDKMEYPEECKKKGMEIDLDYYMKGSVNGQLARLVTYHPSFHVEPSDGTSDALKIADDKIYKNSGKFIDNYCKQYYSNYHQFGKAYQKMYKTADKYLGGEIKQKDVFTHTLIRSNIKMTLSDVKNKSDGREKFAKWFIEMVTKTAEKRTKNYGEEYISQRLDTIPKNRRKQVLHALQRAYGKEGFSINSSRNNALAKTMSILSRRLRENAEDFMYVFSYYHGGINKVTQVIKNGSEIGEEFYSPTTGEAKKYSMEDLSINIDDNMIEELKRAAKENANEIFSNKKVIETLNTLKKIYVDVLAAQMARLRTLHIMEALQSRKNARNRIVVRPDKQIMDAMINADIQSAKKDISKLDI